MHEIGIETIATYIQRGADHTTELGCPFSGRGWFGLECGPSIHQKEKKRKKRIGHRPSVSR